MNKQKLNELEEKISELSKAEKKQRYLYLRQLATGELQGPPVGIPNIDKPWLKHYAKDLITFDLPDKSVYEFVLDANQDNMDNTALEFYGSKITYREFFKKVAETEKAFRKLEIQKGDVVSFCAPTIPETFYAFYALNKIGAIANMIDPRTNASSIKTFIENANSKMLMYIDIAYPKMAPIISELNIDNIVSMSVADSLPVHLKTLYKLKDKVESIKKEKVPVNKKIVDWKEFIKNGKDYTFVPEELTDKLNLPSGIVYTSGTTGIPKGSVMTNKNFLAMVYQNHCSNMGWDKNDILLGIMPPFIAYGLVCGFTLPLCNGMQIDIIPKFESDKFDEYIIKHKPNHIMGVPSYLDNLTKSKKLENKDLSFIKTAIVGGDKLVISSEERINKFLASHGSKATVSKGYGMTEMSSNAVYTANKDSNRLGSVGIPLAENQLKIIDDDGNEIGYNEVGEVCLTGPTLIDGYLNNPEENKKTFRFENGTRWVHTGDNAYMTKDGLVFFQDRLKRIIVRSDGHNVWPSRIEQIIEENPHVKQCCVTGVKDPNVENGEIPTAFITLEDSSLETAEEIIKNINDVCLSRLPERDIALEYFIQDELPLTPVGKIDYLKLSKDGVNNPKVKKIVLK